MPFIARGLISFCALCCWAAPVAGQQSADDVLTAGIPGELAPESSASAAPVAPLDDGASNGGFVEPNAEPVEFDGIQPGVSTFDDVRRLWGEPLKASREREMTTAAYAREPFESVEVTFSNDMVQAIAVRLGQPFAAQEVAEQLELSELTPVLVFDDAGHCMQSAYPERGVAFHSSAIAESDHASGRFEVSEIVFGEIQPRFFLLRAQAREENEEGRALADLDQVLSREPKSGEALTMKARILLRAGRCDDAFEAIETALRSEGETAERRLLHAEASAACGAYADAVAETKQALSSDGASELTQARGWVQLGELLAAGETPDYRQPV
ncbi:MAG TPA: tetratricopeptide repeat protein, partial [Thermomicrobiales bacterium]|nr:tetratricopeptide repeat protein [Thermomicrobiales bacterium]